MRCATIAGFQNWLRVGLRGKRLKEVICVNGSFMKAPHFLNVDLDIESRSSLRGLEREFGDKIIVLFSGRIKGRHCLYLESAGIDGNNSTGQIAVINSLC